MDDADYAQARIETELERALKQRAQGPDLESADCCVDCSELISSSRQVAVPGCQRCAECAALLEARQRHYAKP